MKEMPRSTTSVDISERGIVGQEDPQPCNNEEDNVPSIRGKSRIMKMILLTQCFAGLQLTWAVELAYGTPYLLDLGLSKSIISLVWLAGPLSGFVMQPIVGSLSDNSTSKYGRRRPFLFVGSIAVVCSFLSIGYTKEFVYFFFGDNDSSKVLIQWFAVLSFYILDFSINCVQASCRVLIVDILPLSQQEEGTAWASRMIGIGNVMGYFMGFANLVETFPFFGNTQMQVLCVLAAIIIFVSSLITCWAVNEKRHTGSANNSKSSLASVFETLSSIMKSFRNLPSYVQLICNVQFFAWMGWFPFLFYSTTWVAEVHARSTKESYDDSNDSVGESTRAGSFSLLLYSIVSLIASLVLPLLVTRNTRNETSITTSTSSKFSTKKLFQLPMKSLTLPKLWTISLFILSFSTLATWFVSNTFQASILISLCGISWTVTMWAPYSLLGEFISRDHNSNEETVMYNLVESETTLEGGDNNSSQNNGTDPRVSNEETISELLLMDSHGGISTNHSSEAGVIFGIHNTYIVLPEFLITFFNSIVFAILEPGGNDDDSADSTELVTRQHHSQHPHENLNGDAIGFVLRFGGLMTIVAGLLSLKLWNRNR